MKKFIEKLIERLEEEQKLADETKEKCARENPLMFDNAKGYATGIANAKYIANQLAEEYNAGWIEKLLEAKKNCSEDSDCSECPFSQIEDRCILAELQIRGGNNGWIPCSERLPEIDKDVLVCFSNDMDFVIAYHTRMIETNYEDVWINSSTANRITSNVIAWQPLPAPYQPKGDNNV